MSRHRASSMINIYGLNYCADHTNGNIYEYSLDIYSDNGDPIIKERVTASIHGGLFGVPGKKLFFDEVEFIIVAGATPVEGTGLGAQPVDTTPATPATDCNSIYGIGTLTPDFWTGGNTTETVFTKDLIAGVGDIASTRTVALTTTSDDGNYEAWSGLAVGTQTGIAQVYYPGCQWYNYSGPELFGRIPATRYDVTLVDVVKAGTGTATLTTGISGITNGSGILTDTGAGDYYTGTFTADAGSSPVFDGRPVVWDIEVAKDLTAAQTSSMLFGWVGRPGEYDFQLTFNQSTGAIATVYARDTVNISYEVYDRGNWWSIYVRYDTPTTPPNTSTIRAYISFYPAFNTDGSTSGDVTATGSLRIGHVNYYPDSLTTYDITIGRIRNAAISPTSGTAFYATADDQYVDLANHSDTQGGYYIEWRPNYAYSEIAEDVEILSLNGGIGLLYYDYSAQAITSTDGTNVATVPLSITMFQKYRLGLVFGGGFMRVGVDRVWGTPVAYDGSFPKGTIFQILRTPKAVNYWRELRGFQIPYLDAYNEIEILMLGDGTIGGGSLPPPTPAPTPVELVAPFWSNTGDYIDLTALTNTTFAAMFGASIEGADFNAVYAVNKAALVNTSDSGNRLQIQDSLGCTNAYMAVTQADGTIVDSMVYSNTPNGNSVLVPTGANYYVVISSDTGNAKIKKWDSSPVITTGAEPWTNISSGDAFGYLSASSFQTAFNIPTAGKYIWFTVPSVTTFLASFAVVEIGALAEVLTMSISETIGDMVGLANEVLDGSTPDVSILGGTPTPVHASIPTCTLYPGITYFWNLKWASTNSQTVYLSHVYASPAP